MSIRLIARDLYRLIKAIESLEEQLESAPMDRKESVKNQLRKLKAERNRIRGALEGSKRS